MWKRRIFNKNAATKFLKQEGIRCVERQQKNSVEVSVAGVEQVKGREMRIKSADKNYSIKKTLGLHGF